MLPWVEMKTDAKAFQKKPSQKWPIVLKNQTQKSFRGRDLALCWKAMPLKLMKNGKARWFIEFV